jgi:predicted alpha-1,2-mannosidase
VKKLPGVDWKRAYAAIRKNAFVDQNPAADNRPDRGRYRLDDYRRYHYLPTDVSDYKAITAVSRTLEYVHNDFSVLTLAREFGTPADIADLEGRMLWYKNLWDESSGGFMRGKRKDGTWLDPFDPLREETGKHYYEGHAWTWSWYVPHDTQGLINLHGGTEAFVKKLTTACEKHYEPYNEPGMLQTYLFIHAGRPDLTQQFVRSALRYFSSKPNGLPGNDDSGTTSGWLVWSLMGLYPNAGQDYYYIGSPSFTRSTIKLPAGKKLVISAPAASPENKYIASATLNGKPWNQAWLRHADLINGAVLELEMVPTPTDWGTKVLPPSYSSAK